MESKGSAMLTCIGLGVVVALLLYVLAPGIPRNTVRAPVRRENGRAGLRFLAVGDINLGRDVGQKLLDGDTLYPFMDILDTLAQYDIVFANLESNLSDEDGETQSPENNLIFTGPPAGAWALARAGIGLVSTANNHALDYGRRAQGETIKYLHSANVRFAGTAREVEQLYDPTIITCRNIRVALFACTDVMNSADTSWHRYVAQADTGRILPRLRGIRDSVDFVIVSYHGGEEYRDRPSARAVRFMRSVIAAGADLVLGHHPHVPYGIERIGGRYIVYSLGNFVFSQPSRYWTQRSFGFAAEIVKDSSRTTLTHFHCLPVRCGFQPRFLPSGSEADSIYERIHMLSLTDQAEARQ